MFYTKAINSSYVVQNLQTVNLTNQIIKAKKNM